MKIIFPQLSRRNYESDKIMLIDFIAWHCCTFFTESKDKEVLCSKVNDIVHKLF